MWGGGGGFFFFFFPFFSPFWGGRGGGGGGGLSSVVVPFFSTVSGGTLDSREQMPTADKAGRSHADRAGEKERKGEEPSPSLLLSAAGLDRDTLAAAAAAAAATTATTAAAAGSTGRGVARARTAVEEMTLAVSSRWMQAYRALLNRHRLWIERAELDVAVAALRRAREAALALTTTTATATTTATTTTTTTTAAGGDGGEAKAPSASRRMGGIEAGTKASEGAALALSNATAGEKPAITGELHTMRVVTSRSSRGLTARVRTHTHT